MLSVALTALGIYLIIAQPIEQIFLKIILIPAVIITCSYLIIFFFVKSLINLIYQFRLNKNPRTWVALTLIIFPAILFIVATFILVAISA